MNDGLVTNVSLVVGVAAAHPGRHVSSSQASEACTWAVSLSMAAGEYLRLRVQRELLTARIAQEQQSLRDDREPEHEEVTLTFPSRSLTTWRKRPRGDPTEQPADKE
jgi:VIT1/CCC1 family predicted Fe2+/Mn2+ transporter